MSEAPSRYPGFPGRGLEFTPVPSVFFTRLLPGIDDLDELKVTLHLFWAVHRKKGGLRFVSRPELLADGVLFAGLGGEPERFEARLSTALERSVARGTTLHVAYGIGAEVHDLYHLNTAEGRRAVDRLRRGEAKPLLPLPRPSDPTPPSGVTGLATLYEQRVGLLSPTIARELAHAEREFGRAAVEEAIAEAVRYEKRRWPYIKRVLANLAYPGGGDEPLE